MKMSKQPLALALGAAFALTGVTAHASLFQVSDLGAGYMVASAGDAKTPEAKCGEKKADGKCGADKKTAEHKCGEKGSNCDKTAGAKAGECMCGAAKGKKADGKCGEGKCGAKK